MDSKRERVDKLLNIKYMRQDYSFAAHSLRARQRLLARNGKPSAEPNQDYEADGFSSHKEFMTDVLGKMMFVSGETAEPSVETTSLIEEIVRQQVIEMHCSSGPSRREIYFN
ncbi:hypothetical protein CIHG_00432 [Coccidioides immitis H538.4]|uniref:Uncharacterized protein n=1 Tax=Coccidioides immitis H538.4 TaxID=396776 RepID=A0A0J8RDP2_COCIT|nr:hypothetical protein CIHG_00432 [Coccidioides immitis H538.4]